MRPADHDIARLALPTFGALVAPPLFVLGDSIVVARLGAAPLAGLGIASTVIASVVALCIFLAYGTTSSVSRLLGAGRPRDAFHQGVDGIWLGAGLGVILGAIGLLGAETIVSWFDAEPEVLAAATTYLQISSLAMPALLVITAATGVLRGVQDTRTPLLVAGIASIANLPLNIWLVFGLDLGIAGSAWGTVIVEYAAVLVYLRVVAKGVRAHGARLRPDRDGLFASARAGVPLVVRVVVIRVVIIVAVAVAARLGTAELAAFQLAMALYGLLSLALDAIAIAGQALVGRALGASGRTQARVITRRLVEWGVGSGLALAVVVAVLAVPLTPLLTPDTDVREALLPALLALAVLQIPAGPAFVMDGILIGAGDFAWLAWQAVVTSGVALSALTAVAVTNSGLVALWGALIVWMVARAVLLGLRTRGTTWMLVGA